MNLSLPALVGLVVALVGLVPISQAATEPYQIPFGMLRDPRHAPLPVRACPTETAAQCATEYYRVADDRLNAVYAAARKHLRKHKLEQRERMLIQAQRSWLKYRDDHCAYVGELASDVASAAFHSIACMEEETIRRAYYLEPYAR